MHFKADILVTRISVNFLIGAPLVHISAYCDMVLFVCAHINTDNSQMEAILHDLKSHLNAIPPSSSSHTNHKSWRERVEQANQSWESRRSALFEKKILYMAMPHEAVREHVFIFYVFVLKYVCFNIEVLCV